MKKISTNLNLKKISTDLKRRGIQLLSAFLTNPFIQNFRSGNIYKGPLKYICVPGLNCYSCPSAAGSCPIGAMQTVAGSNRFHISLYVLGFLMIIGSVFGRVICGFLCLFGFLQDLLYKIPAPKLHVPARLDHKLRYLKYLILLFLVILLPAFFIDEFGLGEPFFCKYICPAGTIEAGIPLLIVNRSLRQMAGNLFLWKLLTAGILILASIFIYRPFCRYFCPLGAFYSFFNKISIIHLNLDKNTCVHCHKCETVCPMNVNILKNINTAECIRCGKCKNSCPTGSIQWNKN